MAEEKTYSTYSPIFILTWNPKVYKWDDEYDKVCLYTQQHGAIDTDWSVQTKSPKTGDRFVLMRQGTKDNNGIIGYGHIKSEPYDYMFHMKFIDISLHRLFKENLLTRDELEEMFPDQYWSPQQSGTRVKSKYTVELWSTLQKKAHEKLAPVIR